MLARRVAVVGFCLLGFACNRVPDSEVVAKVNGEPITKKVFEEQVARNLERYKGQNNQLPPSIEGRIKESVLRRMIDDMMIAQKAKDVGIDVTPADLETKFTEYKGRFRTDQAFQDYLTRSKNTEENMRADLKRNLLRDQLVEKLSGTVDVTDDEIGKYYQEHLQRFLEREQIKASRIMLRVQPNATEAEKKSLRKQAEQLRSKALTGDFAELAKQNSNGPQASRGGDLGWITRGRMPPEFDNVAFALEAGKVSAVVETKMGFEIVKVFEKKAERQRPMEEVKESIKNSLLASKRNEKRRDILRDLKTNAKIEQLVAFETGPAEPGALPGGPGAPMPGKLGLKPMERPMLDHGAAPQPDAGTPPDEAAAPAPAPAPQPGTESAPK